jgi:hypothetical protein
MTCSRIVFWDINIMAVNFIMKIWTVFPVRKRDVMQGTGCGLSHPAAVACCI